MASDAERGGKKAFRPPLLLYFFSLFPSFLVTDERQNSCYVIWLEEINECSAISAGVFEHPVLQAHVDFLKCYYYFFGNSMAV